MKMTFGETILFHTLLQDYGLGLVEDDQFIPLMERSKTRVDAVGMATDHYGAND